MQSCATWRPLAATCCGGVFLLAGFFVDVSAFHEVARIGASRKKGLDQERGEG